MVVTAPDLLITRCQEGDREAFALLFETYRDTVYSLALHFTGDESLAADITQEVFLKLLTRIRQFRREAEFKSWLYRIVANTCTSYGRKSRRYVALDEVAGGSRFVVEAPQEAEAMRRQAMAELRGAFLTLGPGLRLALLLRHVAGLTHGEIARVLGVPFGTAAARVSRGHRALEKKLSRLRTKARGGVVPW